jgi:hypothetical protein
MRSNRFWNGYANRNRGVFNMNRNHRSSLSVLVTVIFFAASLSMFACNPEDVPGAGNTATNTDTATNTATSTGNNTSTNTGTATSTNTGTSTQPSGYTTPLSTAPSKDMCPAYQTVSTTRTVGGYNFTNDWACKPSADGTAILLNPAFPFSDAAVNSCSLGPTVAVLQVYNLWNGSSVVDYSSMVGSIESPITAEGYRFPLGNWPAGSIHANAVDRSNSDAWLMFEGASRSASWPSSSIQYVEKSQDANHPGVGCVFYWNGMQVTKHPTYGGNYR